MPDEPLYSATAPPVPTVLTTRLATVRPEMKFRFDDLGSAPPLAYAVMNPVAVGWVAVTVRTTAPTPVLGTPPRPVTARSTEAWPATAAIGAPVPIRVSSRRVGGRDT